MTDKITDDLAAALRNIREKARYLPCDKGNLAYGIEVAALNALAAYDAAKDAPAQSHREILAEELRRAIGWNGSWIETATRSGANDPTINAALAAMARVAAPVERAKCTACSGMGFVGFFDDGRECEDCDGTGYAPAQDHAELVERLKDAIARNHVHAVVPVDLIREAAAALSARQDK